MQRGGHVSSDLQRRQLKAEKIRRILTSRCDLSRARVLDLGAGSGILSAYLRPHCRSIVAADRDVSCFEAEGIEVHEAGRTLPFDPGNFDVVVLNQVLEHVGDRGEQQAALAQIHRVLAADGLLYLAVPNKWTLVEPHYRLPFLSWLPQKAADAWVRTSGRGSWYDCNPLSRRALLEMMRRAGFVPEDASVEAIGHVLDLEVTSGRRRLLRRVPWPLLTPILPAFVVIGRK